MGLSCDAHRRTPKVEANQTTGVNPRGTPSLPSRAPPGRLALRPRSRLPRPQVLRQHPRRHRDALRVPPTQRTQAWAAPASGPSARSGPHGDAPVPEPSGRRSQDVACRYRNDRCATGPSSVSEDEPPLVPFKDPDWRPAADGGLLSWLFAILAATSCDHAGDVSIRVDTLSGGRVLVSNLDRAAVSDSATTRLLEDLRIGCAVDERRDAPDVFGLIVALAIDDASRIYVADYQSSDVRVFGATGSPVRRIGRKGEGPGEFQFLSGIAWQRQTGILWAMDPVRHRLIAFDSTGTLLLENRHGDYTFIHEHTMERPSRFESVLVRRTTEGCPCEAQSLANRRDRCLGHVAFAVRGNEHLRSWVEGRKSAEPRTDVALRSLDGDAWRKRMASRDVVLRDARSNVCRRHRSHREDEALGFSTGRKGARQPVALQRSAARPVIGAGTVTGVVGGRRGRGSSTSCDSGYRVAGSCNAGRFRVIAPRRPWEPAKGRADCSRHMIRPMIVSVGCRACAADRPPYHAQPRPKDPP